MRICYVLLSPTWGMHQYTADLANRRLAAGDQVDLVTTCRVPRDRYAPGVTIHTPAALAGTGFSLEGVRRLPWLPRVAGAILGLRSDVIHFTGPHLWNPCLMDRLRVAPRFVVHTLHDLHPHLGAIYGRLLYLWNGRIQRTADHLLVHGRCYRDELLARSIPTTRVTWMPLTHLFVGFKSAQDLAQALPAIEYEPWALFIGRLEKYKGLDILVEAARQARARVCIAGQGSTHALLPDSLPDGVEVQNRLIEDSEAIDLFRRCSVVVLPYLEASQSALVAAAYFFHKPVIITRTGALPEYVVEGETGWSIAPGDVPALAAALEAALTDRTRLIGMGSAGRAWLDSQRQEGDRVLSELYAAAQRRFPPRLAEP